MFSFIQNHIVWLLTSKTNQIHPKTKFTRDQIVTSATLSRDFLGVKLTVCVQPLLCINVFRYLHIRDDQMGSRVWGFHQAQPHTWPEKGKSNS